MVVATESSAEEAQTSLSFELVSPERVEVARKIRMVTLPGSEGQFAVLVNHAPLVAALRPGVVVIEDAHGPAERFFVDGGFVEVTGQSCTVMVEKAIAVAALDPAQIAEELATLKAADSSLVSAELPTTGSWPKRLILEAMIQAA
ncbi:MAG: ATP synthase F1 subunit epsilon [Alphaproteobacteria bacterium]|nr:ATP synthase F1 subunit epsilon [Alphaproteobacteria bacterium]